MVEVCVQRNVLSAFSTSLYQSDELVGPVIFWVEGSAWGDAETFCGDSESADVRDCEESVAKEAEVVWHQGIGVPTGDNDVVDDRI